ncbi:MAG: Mannitol dehydrogenase protein, partial [Gemmatimonadales bacterium]|nr:Mannitol dehydrogenase protein [Gemmatimonadales bacterium]
TVPVNLPDPSLLALPERAAQFGTGALLRGLIDYIVDAANRQGKFNGRVVAIGSMGSGRDDLVNAQDGLYTLLIEGVEKGAPVREHRVIASLSRALDATTEWAGVLALARNPDIDLIFSNTTEVGIVFDDSDRPDLDPPRSFPGKLTRYLYERARAFDYDPRQGVVVLPCELIDKNGERLREIVLLLARKWQLGDRFIGWIEGSVSFCDTLVDRIVSGAPRGHRSAEVESELGYHDELVTVCEPYRLLAIAADSGTRARLESLVSDDSVLLTDDVSPYRERKVRILNGSHSATVSLALLCGCETVFDAMTDEDVGRFVRRLVLDEILPTVDLPGASQFAHDVLERFSNPFIAHSLMDITLQATTKVRLRVVPSILSYAGRRGHPPPSLSLGFAAFLFFLRGDIQTQRENAGLPVLPDDAGATIRAQWERFGDSDESFADLARTVCSDSTLWGTDLAAITGFVDTIAEHLSTISRNGSRRALVSHLAAGVS